jgi:hypothetical protein
LISGVIPGLAFAPSPDEIYRRASAEGVVYEGLGKYGTHFTTDVGHFFEGYIGRQLGLIENAEVFPEAHYFTREGQKKTVDWLIVLPSAVLLVECKSVLPRRDVVEGWATFRDGHDQIRKGYEQIAATVDAIGAARPELKHIPLDRPFMGLVVTLGAFPAANDTEVLGKPPRGVVSGSVDAEFIEGFVTMPGTDIDAFVQRMLEMPLGQFAEPRNLTDGLRTSANALLEEAFDSLPVIRDLPATQRRRA